LNGTREIQVISKLEKLAKNMLSRSCASLVRNFKVNGNLTIATNNYQFRLLSKVIGVIPSDGMLSIVVAL